MSNTFLEQLKSLVNATKTTPATATEEAATTTNSTQNTVSSSENTDSNVSKNNPWVITLPTSDVYSYTEEVVSSSEMLRQDASNTMSYLLQNVTDTIKAIEKYLIKANIEFKDTSFTTSNQTFTIGNKQYLLNKPDILRNITQIIHNLDDVKLKEKTLSKQSNNLTFLNYLLQKPYNFNNYILQKLPFSLICKLVLRTLSIIVTTGIISKKLGPKETRPNKLIREAPRRGFTFLTDTFAQKSVVYQVIFFAVCRSYP